MNQTVVITKTVLCHTPIVAERNEDSGSERTHNRV